MLFEKTDNHLTKSKFIHNKKLFQLKSPLSTLQVKPHPKSISKSKKPKSRNSFSTSSNNFKLNSSITSKKNINNTIVDCTFNLSKNTLSKPKKLSLKKLTSSHFSKPKAVIQKKIEIKKDKLISLIKTKANNLRQKHKSFLDMSSNEYTQTKLSTETSATSKRNVQNKKSLPNSLKHNHINKFNKHKDDELINVITEESVFTSKNNSCSKNVGGNNCNSNYINYNNNPVILNSNKKMAQQWDLDGNIEISLTYSDDTVTKRRCAIDNEVNVIQYKRKEYNTRNHDKFKGQTINIQENNYMTNYKNNAGNINNNNTNNSFKTNSDFQSFCAEMQYRLFGC